MMELQLSTLKPRALKKRARALEVDEEKIDEADDADNVRARLIALIVEKEEEKAEAARSQAQLPPGRALRHTGKWCEPCGSSKSDYPAVSVQRS